MVETESEKVDNALNQDGLCARACVHACAR